MKLSGPLALVASLVPGVSMAQQPHPVAVPRIVHVGMLQAVPALAVPQAPTPVSPLQPAAPAPVAVPVPMPTPSPTRPMPPRPAHVEGLSALMAQIEANPVTVPPAEFEALHERLDQMRFALKDMKLAVPAAVDGKSLIGAEFMRDLVDRETLAALEGQFTEETRQRMDEARVRVEESRLRSQEAVQRAQEVRVAIPRPVVSGDSAYNAGLSLLNQRRFDQAIQQFDRVITRKEARADGAMYHKAFAQSRSGRAQEALDTIAALRRDFPQSRYLADAKVLEADVKRMAGQPINLAAADDDEIKLLAINGIQKSDQAIPLLEGVLAAANSLRVKKQALFVLAGNADPRARAVLLRHAKGDGNPDLQVEAIRLLVSRRDGQTTNRELREIYENTQDIGVRQSIIDAYRSSSDKSSLFAIASNQAAAVDLRGRAVMSLSELASPDELWTLFQQETNAALRSQMVSAFSSMRALDHLSRIARTDADASVRRRAISSIGSQRGDQAAKARQTLLDLYASQTETATKMSIISALNSTEGAEALVTLARKETSLELKRAIVQRLSDMAPRSKVAADYLMEVIK